MATTPTKPELETTPAFRAGELPAWPRGERAPASAGLSLRNVSAANPDQAIGNLPELPEPDQGSSDSVATAPTQRNALQALLAFSALHEQVRRRKALAARHAAFDGGAPAVEFEASELFVLDDVLRLVAERALSITGADGLAIALAQNNEIVLRASAGTVRPDVGARIDRNSAFSGACFRNAEIVTCDDTETDPRVNLQACRQLGARSMIAVPLCGRHRVIGLIEAFSSWPFGFNDSDVRNLSLLAELVLGALKPEDEDRFAASAEVAVQTLEPVATPKVEAPPVVASAAPAASLPALESAPVIVEKPAETKLPAANPPAMAPVVDAPVIDATPVEASAAVVTPVAKPEIAAGAPAEELAAESEGKNRPLMLALLVLLVIAAAFAGGVWWKLKTAQIGKELVTDKSVSKAENTNANPAPAAVAPAVPAATATDTSADITLDGAADNTAPATPQELSKFPHVTGVRHWSSADSSTVVLDLDDQVQYEAHRLSGPDRIYFDLHDTQLAPELSGKSIDIGDTLLNKVRIAQPVAGMTRIVLETKANTSFSVSMETNPYRLLVEVRRTGSLPKPTVNLFPDASRDRNKLAIVVPPPTKEDLQLRARVPKMRIVVDAGHGGWDLGTVGKRGLLEKDVVLEVAQRLGKLLESRLGTEVIYTRQDDNYIPLDERAEIANQAQADLFVSVHANYSDLPSARGVETYYTSTFTAPGSKEAGAKDVDARANLGGARPGVTPTLSSADLHTRIDQSRRLAASVQRSLYGTLSAQNPGLRDRGVKEAGFVVLTESAMPGILAEVSFVSSPADEQRLRSDGYREQIAEALYRGIARYAAASKGVKVASASK